MKFRIMGWIFKKSRGSEVNGLRELVEDPLIQEASEALRREVTEELPELFWQELSDQVYAGVNEGGRGLFGGSWSPAFQSALMPVSLVMVLLVSLVLAAKVLGPGTTAVLGPGDLALMAGAQPQSFSYGDGGDEPGGDWDQEMFEAETMTGLSDRWGALLSQVEVGPGEELKDERRNKHEDDDQDSASACPVITGFFVG